MFYVLGSEVVLDLCAVIFDLCSVSLHAIVIVMGEKEHFC